MSKVLAFEKGVLAFEKGVLAFEKRVLALEKGCHVRVKDGFYIVLYWLL